MSSKVGVSPANSPTNSQSPKKTTFDKKESSRKNSVMDSTSIPDASGKIVKVSPEQSRPPSATAVPRKSAWDKVRENGAIIVKKNRETTTTTIAQASDKELESGFIGNGMCWDTLKLLGKICRSKKFRNSKLERLYQRYFLRLNQSSLTSLLGILIIIAIALTITHYIGGKTTLPKGITLGVLILVYVLLEVLCNRNAFNQNYLVTFGYIVLLTLIGIEVLVELDTDPRSTTNGVWCTIFFIYMSYTLLPIGMRFSVLAGVILAATQLICAGLYNQEDEFLWKQVRQFMFSIKNICIVI